MNEYSVRCKEVMKQIGLKFSLVRCTEEERVKALKRGCFESTEFDAAYKCKLSYQEHSYTFHWFCHDAAYPHPSAYDCISALEMYEIAEDFQDFAKEYGYSLDTKEEITKAKKIHKNCAIQYRKLKNLLGVDNLEKLAEVCR